MNIIQNIKNQAKGLHKRVIFPEATDDRILKAVEKTTKDKIIKAVLVGDESEINKKARSLKIKLTGVEIINPKKSTNLEKYTKIYSQLMNTPEDTAKSIVQSPLFFASLVLAAGDVDGMVAGAINTSGDVIAVSKNILGLQPEILVPSSFFLMEIPKYKGGENGVLMYADASVNPNPTEGELADIALISGQSAKRLLKWKPRVAILSFSTKGSADHRDVCKVKKAGEIAIKKLKDRDISIDYELQADSALVIETAKKKIRRDIGKVAGKANVLIFPDLDAGNISYKLTQILAGANAYGPILQGFNKPVSDLSRGATVEDIIGVISIISVLASRWKK